MSDWSGKEMIINASVERAKKKIHTIKCVLASKKAHAHQGSSWLCITLPARPRRPATTTKRFRLEHPTYA